jgi:NAD(P)-dependent dehydrogenase (short-subunit alcohol dehydrogenase family)
MSSNREVAEVAAGGRSRFDGTIALVVGSARGIGQAVTLGLLSEGAAVVAMDADEQTLDEAWGRHPATSRGQLVPVLGDTSQRGDVLHALELCRRLGRLNVVVQVAGISGTKSFLEMDDALWDRILAVNLTGTLFVVQESARGMLASETNGSIVVTTSTNAFQPEQGLTAYNASKAAQVAVVKTAAMELAPFGVRVNAVAPGITNTTMTATIMNSPAIAAAFLGRLPIGRFAEPGDIAAPILFLCSDDARYITGEVVVVDGAWSVGLPTPANAAPS